MLEYNAYKIIPQLETIEVLKNPKLSSYFFSIRGTILEQNGKRIQIEQNGNFTVSAIICSVTPR